MHRAESLMVGSIEGLLSGAERTEILALMQAHMRGRASEAWKAGANERSIHSIPGASVGQTVSVYEPAGRVEIQKLPEAVTDIVSRAVRRRWTDIQRLAPSVDAVDDWVYLEYGVGQHVTPHVDYPLNEDRPAQPKVLGISVSLNDGYQGGEFFVDTTADARLWTGQEGDLEIAPLANGISSWFNELSSTRWMTKPAPGSALLYGTRTIHGTLPVTGGRACKLIGWLLTGAAG